MMCGHVFFLEKRKLNEHQDRKTREVERSFAGLQRKKQGHICTPTHYEAAKCEPHTFMPITGKVAWFRQRCQQGWQKHEGTSLTVSKEGGIYPDLRDSLSAAGPFVMVKVTAENSVWMVLVTFWLCFKSMAKMLQDSRRLILTFNL